MLLSDYLKHLWSWILTFPTPSDDSHAFCRAIGDPEETCLVCGRTQIDPYFNAEADRRMAERYPCPEEES